MCASVGDYLLCLSPEAVQLNFCMRLLNPLNNTAVVPQGYWILTGKTMQVTNNLIKQTKNDYNLQHI